MKTLSLLGVVALLCTTSSAGAQSAPTAGPQRTPDALRCSALTTMDPGAHAAAIYYIAGYYSAQRDLTTVAVTGQSPATVGAVTADPAQPGQAGSAGADATPVPTLPLEAIVATCSQSPDSRIVDVITAHGGI